MSPDCVRSGDYNTVWDETAGLKAGGSICIAGGSDSIAQRLPMGMSPAVPQNSANWL